MADTKVAGFSWEVLLKKGRKGNLDGNGMEMSTVVNTGPCFRCSRTKIGPNLNLTLSSRSG